MEGKLVGKIRAYLTSFVKDGHDVFSELEVVIVQGGVGQGIKAAWQLISFDLLEVEGGVEVLGDLLDADLRG
jgi:hypothetical protein